MFDFQTNTIINSKDVFKTLTVEDSPVLKINKEILINSKYVTNIEKKPYESPVNASVTFALSEFTGNASWRIVFELRLEGDNNLLFANALPYKSKPLFIEFITKSDDEAKDVANTIKYNVNHYMLDMYGMKLFTISFDNDTNPTKITFTVTNEFIRFHKAVVEKYNEDMEHFENEGFIETVKPSTEERGSLGNGSYAQLLRDVRIPTDANIRFKHLYEDETPIIGGTYNQYIITMCVPRTSFRGQSAVGQKLETITSHVFWVLNGEVSTKFDTALATLEADTSNTVTTSDTTSNTDNE